jgi:hypothetical protein
MSYKIVLWIKKTVDTSDLKQELRSGNGIFHQLFSENQG